MITRQDFSLINENVKKYKKDFDLDVDSSGFTYFALNLILGLQDDEIKDAITDNHLSGKLGKGRGPDRGIDAVHIDYDYEDTSGKATVYFFNFKYTSEFNISKNNNFPAGEIDKITKFIDDLMQDEIIKNTINPSLFDKVEEILTLFKTTNPSFVMCLCTNHSLGLEKLEKERFEKAIRKYSNFEIKYYLIENLTALITNKSRQIVNARIRAIDKQLFEKTNGNVRALITNIDAKDLIRVVLNDESIRNNTDVTDYSELKNYSIFEDAFEDNVRIYLKQRSKINKNIKSTALSEENYTFFYFNNGITITCQKFEYTNRRSPIITLTNIQVVNGSQTIHALYEAFLQDSSKFENIEILCRIYETNDLVLSTKIAEYTNSQNPVKSRDVRSIDIIQQKLEQEFLLKDLYYERKKGQYSNKNKTLRLDAEKVGQVLMAFYNEMPREAKNRKKMIFGEKYDEIFNDEITADKVLLPYKLFEKIEQEKAVVKASPSFSENRFIVYSSYYILYIMSKLCEQRSISLELNNFNKIWNLYSESLDLIREVIEDEQTEQKERFSVAVFFNTERPKKILERHFL
jgi:hypothetical protein